MLPSRPPETMTLEWEGVSLVRLVSKLVTDLIVEVWPTRVASNCGRPPFTSWTRIVWSAEAETCCRQF